MNISNTTSSVVAAKDLPYTALCHIAFQYANQIPPSFQAQSFFMWRDPSSEEDKVRFLDVPLRSLRTGTLCFIIRPAPDDYWHSPEEWSTILTALAKVFVVLDTREATPDKEGISQGYAISIRYQDPASRATFSVHVVRPCNTTKGFFYQNAHGEVANARHVSKVRIMGLVFYRSQRTFLSLLQAL
jgi:hypothetical protein